jgi:hypothetical protein
MIKLDRSQYICGASFRRENLSRHAKSRPGEDKDKLSFEVYRLTPETERPLGARLRREQEWHI